MTTEQIETFAILIARSPLPLWERVARIERSEIEPGEGECPDDARIPLTRFAASPLSTLSHKGRGEEPNLYSDLSYAGLTRVSILNDSLSSDGLPGQARQ